MIRYMEQPVTRSLVPEAWFKIGQGVDRESGRPFVQVARNKDGAATTWRIEYTTNRNGKSDWRAVSHSTSQGENVSYSSPRALSHSEIDTTLRRMCGAGQWIGTEWFDDAQTAR
jgi:hypothetical protein